MEYAYKFYELQITYTYFPCVYDTNQAVNIGRH